jgi:hypothetical protein
MKSLSVNSRHVEIAVFTVLWLLVFSVPFFATREFTTAHWDTIFLEWAHLGVFLFVFLVNVYLLVPLFLFRNKYLLYGSGAFLLVVLVIGTMLATDPRLAPYPDSATPPSTIGPDTGLPRQHNRPPHMVVIDNLIITILVIGAGTAAKVVTKWLDEQALRKDIEKEQLKTTLTLLRHQVSPHFFMNTLNNIHALIDTNTDHAKDAIIRLSLLMRYLLYDSAEGTTTLSKEIDFINSYVSLMRLRYPDGVDIQVRTPAHLPATQIPPMLFVSFLENAFKHGVRYQSPSFIHIDITLQPGQLSCSMRNSKHDTGMIQEHEYNGLGIENIKKTLQLLFQDRFMLNIMDGPEVFEVQLRIPL